MVAAKLHNFVIENDTIGFQKAGTLKNFGVESIADRPNNNSGFLRTDPKKEEHSNTGVSSRQVEIIVGEIQSLEIMI